MTLDRLLRYAIEPALSLLPEWMDTPQARALVLAIALQESGARHRRQVGGGRAVGYHQWEPPGNGPVAIDQVLTHPATWDRAQEVLLALDYEHRDEPAEIHAAMEHNDVLDAAFARLLLVTLPEPLPHRGEAGLGWSQYLRTWRPGRPRPQTWGSNVAVAWEAVEPLPPTIRA